MTKKTEWVAKGAPEQLTDFLDAAVANMHTKAVENDYLHKDNDGTDVDGDAVDPIAAGINDILDVEPDAENVEKDADENTATDVNATADADGAEEGTADEDAAENADVSEDTADGSEGAPTLQKAIEDMLVASLKEYHDVVVLPLQKRLAELESLTKEQGDSTVQALSSIALLPPAQAAASIKKAFTVESDENEGNDEATEKELGDAVTDVTEDEGITTPLDNASTNLLTGF